MKGTFETAERSSMSLLDKSLIAISFIPVVFSVLRMKIVQSVGYLVFFFGSIPEFYYEKTVNQQIPQNLKTLFRIHILLHSFFGQFLGFYDSVPFFDKGLHFVGSALGSIFFYFIVATNSKFWKAELDKKRAVFISFLLTNFAGIIWEIAEFIADEFFSLNAQRGLQDTMLDLIFNILGAYAGSRFLVNYHPPIEAEA